MITKEKFVSYFDRLKKFWEVEEKVSDAFKDLNFMSFSYCDFEDLMLDVLMDAMNDTDEFIAWWIYDRECGEKDSTVKYVDADGVENEVELKTAEDLYNFLVKEYK